jgi:hypothetical protein
MDKRRFSRTQKDKFLKPLTQAQGKEQGFG